MAKLKSAPLGATLVVLSSVFYASYGIWTTLMGNFFGGYTASALRSLLVVVILLPIAFVYRQLGPITWRRDWPYLVGFVLSSLFVWGPLYYAILQAGIGISLAINYASLVLGMFFFGWLLADERLTQDKLLSASLGIIGLYFIFSPNISRIGWLPLSAAALSGLCGASNAVIAKKIPYNTTQSTIILWIASTIANVSMAFFLKEHQPTVGLYTQWLYLLIFTIATIGASWSFVKGIKLVDAGAAGILGLLEIVFGVIFGIVFFKERPSWIVLVGVLIIITAAAIPYIKDYNAKRGTLDE